MGFETCLKEKGFRGESKNCCNCGFCGLISDLTVKALLLLDPKLVLKEVGSFFTACERCFLISDREGVHLPVISSSLY